MAVLTASQAGTPAVEAAAGEYGVMKPGEHGQLWYAVLAFGIAAAGFLAAWGLHGNTASTYRVDGQWSAFTGLFILALAIERALEPFSRKLGPDTTKRKNHRNRYLSSLVSDWMRGVGLIVVSGQGVSQVTHSYRAAGVVAARDGGAVSDRGRQRLRAW